MAKPGPKPKNRTASCSNCLSHREPKSKGMYGNKPICHFWPKPDICISADHWCRQWEEENGKDMTGLDVLPELRPDAPPPTMA